MTTPKRQTIRKHIAIYVRVSSDDQSHASQMPELEDWATKKQNVVWYLEKESGHKNKKRNQWRQLEDTIHAGQVSTLVCWRLDRLGRTTSELTSLIDVLVEREINLVSLRDGLDLSTATGRFFARMLASMAEYETEMRKERQMRGIKAAKAAGKTWGGSKKGRKRRDGITQEKRDAVLHLHEQKTPIARIAKSVNMSRPTVYKIIREAAQVNVSAS